MSEEGEDAGSRSAAAGQIVIFQSAGIAAIRNGVEIERESLFVGEQAWHQLPEPAAEELFLLVALGGEGEIVGEGLLWQNVEAGIQAQGFVEIELDDWATAFFVEKLEGEQAQQGAAGGNHLRTGVARLLDNVVKADLSQQGQEQEDAGRACAQAAAGSQRQAATIGHGRCF